MAAASVLLARSELPRKNVARHPFSAFSRGQKYAGLRGPGSYGYGERSHERGTGENRHCAVQPKKALLFRDVIASTIVTCCIAA